MTKDCDSYTPETGDKDSDMDDFGDTSFHQPNPKYLGRKLQMRFKIEETGSMNGLMDRFFRIWCIFPLDGQTVYINASQEGDYIVFFSLVILSALEFHSSIGDVHHY